MNTIFLDSTIENTELFTEETRIETEKTWFCGSDFCLFYLHPPIKGFSRWEDKSGNIIQECYYHESRFLGSYKIIDIYSSRPINVGLIAELIQKKKGRVGCIRLLYRDELPKAIAEDPKTIIIRESEDMIVDLPDTYDDYIKSLGPNARRHARHRGEKIWNQFSGRIKKEITQNKEIDFKAVEKILELNKVRMQKKGTPYLSNIERNKQWHQLARKCGLLVTIKIDNQIVAGTLTYAYKENNQAYMVLIGNDIAYDQSHLGSVCDLETIKELIELKIKNLHLLWGDSFYKHDFGAKRNDLFEICLPKNTIDRIMWPLLRRLRLIAISRSYWSHLLIKNPSELLLLLQNYTKKK